MKSIYESDQLVAEYLLFHYGTADETLPPGHIWPAGMTAALGFCQRTVAHFSPGPAARALDLGCAVGGATFELARSCHHVIGIDSSAAFIATANSLLENHPLVYPRREEGHVQTLLTARPPADVPRDRIAFRQADAMDLPADLGAFDRVHAANLLCRLPEPQRLLNQFPALVTPGGQLVLATPATWLENFTPPANWPPATTLEWLKAQLTPHFELLDCAEEPFLIRETARKFQWSLSLVSLWQRKPAV